MPTLLVRLKGSKLFNKTPFPPYLYVYDDLVIYRKRNLIHVWETTISYNQIANVALTKSPLFAKIEIITTGTDDIMVKYVSKKDAMYAKKIIDQKIFHSHAKHRPGEDTAAEEVRSYEKSLNRLWELLQRGRISRREYNKRKSKLLKDMK